MQRFAWPLFAATIAIAVAVILAPDGQLPAVVATHDGAGGRADGWMKHAAYTALIVTRVVAAPRAVAAATTWLPRVAPSLLKLDRCKRWADPAARPAILASTALFGAIVGALTAAFIAVLHLLVVDAHTRTPPHLDESRFVLLAVTFAVAMVVASAMHAIGTRRA
jgi:hypothetical protein